MHYVLFVGIFGLPVVVGVGMLAATVLDRFAPEEPPASGIRDTSHLPDAGSRERELADSFFAAAVETESTS